MAERPYFTIYKNTVDSGMISFQWFAGLSASQKQKSVQSMHCALRAKGKKPLEISTKSEDTLGKKLSAFNLKLDGYYLENVFQSSKVFAVGGPYVDLLNVAPKEAKKDARLKESGRLLAFRYKDMDWPLTPKTVFYDYIYYNAVREALTDEELKQLCEYDAFTDIEFNPDRSINTQARTAALVVLVYSLFRALPEMSPEEFIQFHKNTVKA